MLCECCPMEVLEWLFGERGHQEASGREKGDGSGKGQRPGEQAPLPRGVGPRPLSDLIVGDYATISSELDLERSTSRKVTQWRER